MNNQIQNNQPFNRRDARRQRRADRRASLGAPTSSGTLVLGVILIVLGGAFLMQNMGTFIFPWKNWGALFILIPAIGALERAYRFYRNADNQLTTQAGGALLVGFVLIVVTVLILFELSWTYFGPILVIMVGFGILVNAMFSKR